MISSNSNDFKWFIKYSYNLHKLNELKLNFKAYEKTNKTFFKFFFLYMKMTNKYYEKHKEKLQKEAREIYQNVSEEKNQK